MELNWGKGGGERQLKGSARKMCLGMAERGIQPGMGPGGSELLWGFLLCPSGLAGPVKRLQGGF